MKPFIPWMGGKSRLADKILPLFPEHTCYVEVFAGAGAIYFKKEPSKVEVLNDLNGELVNLYRVIQHHLEEFMRQFKWALSSRQIFEWEKAKKPDLLFVDPYLDAEFVSRYLPHVNPRISIRLLTRKGVQTLLPAVDQFAKQSGATINVRSTPEFHDRYVIVDQAACYQSGTSFKDGAKKAPTTVTQITDAFKAVLQTYEDLWNSAKVER